MIGYELNITYNRCTAYVFNSQGKRLAEIETSCRFFTEKEIKESYPSASEIITRKGRVYFTGAKEAPSFTATKWSKMLTKANA